MLEPARHLSGGKDGKGGGEWQRLDGLGDGCNSRFLFICMIWQFFLNLKLKRGSNSGELEASVQAHCWVLLKKELVCFSLSH